MLQRLRNKLTIMCVAATTLILCMMAAVSLYISERDFARSEQEAFQSKVNSLALYLRSNTVVDGIYLTQFESGNRLLLYIEENGYPLLFSSGDGQKRAELLECLTRAPVYTDALRQWELQARHLSSPAQGEVLLELTDTGGVPFHAGVVDLAVDGGRLRLYVFGDTSLLRAGILRRRILFAAAVLASAGLLALFSWWFSGRAIAPVARGQKQQSEFIAAVSHEMRTPLATIQASAESMDIAQSDSDRQRFTSIIKRECSRTARLVGDMLTLASIDSRGWGISPGPIELPELLQEVLESYGPIAAKKQIHLSARMDGRLSPIVGDAARLQQVLGILLDNAVRYTPREGTITLRASQRPRETHLLVADSGAGMTDAQKRDAFTRFYRADTARTRGEHYGLGLSIAWELIQMHGGRIALEDTPGGGLTVRIVL